MHAVRPQPRPPEDARNRRVLVVDDNPSIHEDLKKILVADGSDDLGELESALFGATAPAPKESYEITSAFHGQEAARLCAAAVERGEPFAMAFVDVRMPPGWDGVRTVEELWAIDDSLQIAICTAYSDYTWQGMRARLGDQDGLLVLKKPFDDIEVQQIASSLTRKWDRALVVQQQLRELASSAMQRPVRIEAPRTDSRVSLSVADNYVRISMKGRIDAVEAEATLASLISSARQLRAGFTIITDLREARPASEAVAEYVGAAQIALFEMGAKRAVRIVGDGSASANMQLSRTQREAKAGYAVVVVTMEEEALRLARSSV